MYPGLQFLGRLNGKGRILWQAVTLFLLLLTGLAGVAGAQSGTGRDSVLAVEAVGTVDPGLAAMVKSAAERVRQEGYRGLVLVVDTPGGLVQSAITIRDTVLRAEVPTVAFVRGRAISAGALITLAAGRIYMAPGSSIGDAEPIPYSDKSAAFVRSEFEATAEAQGRDPKLAGAMVDKSVVIEGVTTGKPLTLSYKRAEELGLSNGTAPNLAAALEQAGLGGLRVETYTGDLSARVARVLTNPFVAGALLLVGIGALAWEFTHPGLGLPGLVGIVSLGAFLGSHFLVGTAGWLELGMVVLGILLLAIEMFVPGFGIFGASGLIVMATGIFLTAPSPQQALIYLSTAAVGLILFLVFFVRYLARHGLGRWLTLESRLDSSAGYVPARRDLVVLVGQSGVLVSACRPAGMARLGSERIDVVSEGGFLPRGQSVTVVHVEGTRVVVRAVDPPT